MFQNVGAAAWTQRNAVQPGAGGPGLTVPLAANQANWRGDPVMASVGNGAVVSLNLADDIQQQGGDAEMVVASISVDGGRTFVSTVRASNASGDCGGGSQDQPAVAVDNGTTPPGLWIVYRHRGSGIGTYGGCVRCGTVVVAPPALPTINWFGSAVTVDNMDRDDELYGQGGLLIVANSFGPNLTRITVMYSNTDHAFFDCSGGKNLAWDTVTSDNLGIDWHDAARITETNDFNWGSANCQVTNSLRDFWIAQDPVDGRYWAAVHENPTDIGVFYSPEPGGSWVRATTLRQTNRNLFQPNIAVDSLRRVVVTTFMTNATGTQIARFMAKSSTAATSGDPTSGWTPLVGMDPFFAPGRGNSFAGGDYQSLIPVPPAALPGSPGFFAAWSRGALLWTAPMRHALLVPLLGIAGCSCAASHILDGGTLDATRDGSEGSDVSSGDAAPRECLPREDVGRLSPWIPMAHCTDSIRRSCSATARAVGGSGALSTCVESLPTCSVGTNCGGGGPTGDWCWCLGGTCSADAVCVSGPDDRQSCEQICLSRSAAPRLDCMSDPPPVLQAHLSMPCDDSARALCDAWAQSFARIGTAVTACSMTVAGVFCGHGDACTARGESDVLESTCGGATCAPNEICVREDDGPPHCSLACFPPEA
jgi:hypothetical protein